jgi:hypothetical protein
MDSEGNEPSPLILIILAVSRHWVSSAGTSAIPARDRSSQRRGPQERSEQSNLVISHRVKPRCPQLGRPSIPPSPNQLRPVFFGLMPPAVLIDLGLEVVRHDVGTLHQGQGKLWRGQAVERPRVSLRRLSRNSRRG